MTALAAESRGFSVLSIHYGHNATVGLSNGGAMVSLISEERITRIKNATGFPQRALSTTIETHLEGDPTLVDLLVLSDATLGGYRYLQRHGLQAKPYRDYFWKEKDDKSSSGSALATAGVVIRHAAGRLTRGVRRSPDQATEFENLKGAAFGHLEELTGIPQERIHLVNHHVSHALTPLYFVGLDKERLIFTLDAVGDELCASVTTWSPQSGSLTSLATTPADRSLGVIYSEVTGYLGMKPDEHEYKVMGLSPYADGRQAERLCGYFQSLLSVRNGEFVAGRELRNLRRWMKKTLLYERFDNVAGGLQLFTERILRSWVDYWVQRTQISQLCLSGGVFMNVKASQQIAELRNVREVFVTPSCGDESLPIGACLQGQLTLGTSDITPVTHLYLGRDLSEAEIDEELGAHSVTKKCMVEQLDEEDLAARVAELLADGEIVAVARGREEWGARALGHRSIWCRPDDVSVVQTLNKQIKSRDFWMPFAPSILEGSEARYLREEGASTVKFYMSIAADTTSEGQRALRAASHQYDLSVRPQVIRQEWNPFAHRVISIFSDLTQMQGILNTSFNLHGEPIVGGAKDALDTLQKSALRNLVLGTRLIRRREGSLL